MMIVQGVLFWPAEAFHHLSLINDRDTHASRSQPCRCVQLSQVAPLPQLFILIPACPCGVHSRIGCGTPHQKRRCVFQQVLQGRLWIMASNVKSWAGMLMGCENGYQLIGVPGDVVVGRRWCLGHLQVGEQA